MVHYHEGCSTILSLTVQRVDAAPLSSALSFSSQLPHMPLPVSPSLISSQANNHLHPSHSLGSCFISPLSARSLSLLPLPQKPPGKLLMEKSTRQEGRGGAGERAGHLTMQCHLSEQGGPPSSVYITAFGKSTTIYSSK